MKNQMPLKDNIKLKQKIKQSSIIKLKLYQLEYILPSLRNISQIEFPLLIAYNISKLNKKLQEEYKTYKELQSKLINKYALRDKNNKIIYDKDLNGRLSISKIPELSNECDLKFDELNNLECEINFEKISIGELNQCGVNKIKPQDLEILNDFFID